jgi:hypothetical protein
MRGRNGTWHRYYYCRNHDPLRAGGEHRRCPERNIRADQLDAFVFDQVRAALLRPQVLLAGQAAVAVRQPAPDDQLLAAQLARLQRKLDGAQAERRRLVDLYQAGLLELTEVGRRAAEVDARRQQLADQQVRLAAERGKLAEGNRLRQRLAGFAERVTQAFDGLDFDQRQRLLRLVIDQVRVTGRQVEIRLRIPLDEPPDADPPWRPPAGPARPSTDMRLRSLGGDDLGVVDQPVDHGRGDHIVAEHLTPTAKRLVGADDQRGALIAGRDQREEQRGRLWGEGDVADLVADQQRDAAQPLQFAIKPSGPLGGVQPLDPLVGSGERDPVAAAGRLDGQRDRQVGLAGAWWAEEHDVVGLQQEVELGEVGDELLADRPLEGEVEVVQGLDGRQPGRLDSGCPTRGLPRNDLLLEHGGQVTLVVPALGAGPLGQRPGRSPDAWRLQHAGEVDELGRRSHDPTSASSS